MTKFGQTPKLLISVSNGNTSTISPSGTLVDAAQASGSRKSFDRTIYGDTFAAGDPYGDCGKNLTSEVHSLISDLYSGTTVMFKNLHNTVHSNVHRFNAVNQTSFRIDLSDFIDQISNDLCINYYPNENGFIMSDNERSVQVNLLNSTKSLGLATYLVDQLDVDLPEGLDRNEAITRLDSTLRSLDTNQTHQFTTDWVSWALSINMKSTQPTPMHLGVDNTPTATEAVMLTSTGLQNHPTPPSPLPPTPPPNEPTNPFLAT